MNTKSTRLAALRAAFPYTVPIFAGFWFVGVAYGVYMNASGFSFWYPLFMSALIFGGSLEFIAVALLLSPFAPMQTFLLALMVQARHIFYGLSMFEKSQTPIEACRLAFYTRYLITNPIELVSRPNSII